MDDDHMFEPLPTTAESTELVDRRRRRSEWRPLVPVPADAPPPPAVHPTLGKPSHQWPYRDRNGALLMLVYRFETSDGGKEIRPLSYCQRSASGEREWRWKILPRPRPLYGLDKLAAQSESPVIITEGELAAEAAERLLPGHVVTTSPGGAKAADSGDWSPLAQRLVVLWPDADAAGDGFAVAVVAHLRAIGADVSVVVPPADVAAGWDLADVEAEGWDSARTLALIEAALPVETWLADPSRTAVDGAADEAAQRPGGRRGGPPQRDLLLAVAESAEFWHDPSRRAYASVPVADHVEHWPVRTREFRLWLAARYLDEGAATIGGQAFEDALRTLEAIAVYRRPCHPTWRRVAEWEGKIYLDLCDDAWRVIEIGPDGWQVVKDPPVRFLRTAYMRPLPGPLAGEPIEHLRGFLHLASDDDFKRVVGWAVAALRPRGPYPVLILGGEQGTTKSTAARIARSLIDPHEVPIRALPQNERDLFVSASNNYVLCYDNISHIPDWLSDAFCRLATGGGFATRQLHTDADELVLTAQMPLCFNGITDLASRPDLADRAIVVNLPRLGKGTKRAEDSFWREFEAARPEILGALLTAVSSALRHLGSVDVSADLRMADFGQWVTAAEPGLGWEMGSIVAAFQAGQEAAMVDLVQDDLLASPLLRLLEEDEWELTAAGLLSELERRVPERHLKLRSWPKSPSALGKQLVRLAPALRYVGISATSDREKTRQRRRLWTIKRTEPT
jgi:hypothetical protein